MLNIAMLSYHTCPLAVLGGKDTGGMNVYVRELTRKLGEINIHVDVFTRSQDDHVPHVLHDLGYGCRVVHIPAGPETPIAKADLKNYIPEFTQGILDFARDKNIHYNLIHSHYWLSGLAAIELQKSWHVPIVQMFHTLGQMKNRIARTPAEKEGSYRVEGEEQVIRSADRIVAATLAEKAQLEFLYSTNSDKIAIIPPGVDTSRFYPIPKDEARAAIDAPFGESMILFVGRIEALKGIDILLKAMAILKQNGIQCELPHELAIIGGDPSTTTDQLNSEMSRLKDLSKQLGLDNFVFFLGKRGQDTLPYYYSAADLIVVPSHYESFGMVALEAMACGTPVLASQVGGLAFLIKDGVTGFVLPNDNPSALADRIATLLIDDQLRTQMGKQAAAYAQDFSWQNIALQISALYDDVLGDQ
ncbi:MAG: glycosyltransferase family 1 protein [Anaerolineaceae bacterium]|nr:glycosyltransferase family 1 protein [Anaerolineaceae bacterium]